MLRLGFLPPFLYLEITHTSSCNKLVSNWTWTVGCGLDERLKSTEFKGEQYKIKLYSNVDMYK